MKLLPQVRDYLEEDFASDPNIRGACSRIVDFIEAHSSDEVTYLSFGHLLDIAGSKPEEGFAAVQYLSGARSRVLEAKFEFIEDDSIEELDASDLAEAGETGVFYHPIEGTLVEDYQEKVFLYFVPGPGVVGP